MRCWGSSGCRAVYLYDDVVTFGDCELKSVLPRHKERQSLVVFVICGENLCPDIQTNISFVTVFIYIRSMDLLSTTEAAKLKNTSPQVVLRAVKRGETRWAKEKRK